MRYKQLQGRKENAKKICKERRSGAKKGQEGSGKLQDTPQAIRVHSSALGLCTTVQGLNSTCTCMGSLHSFDMSPPWHGLTVFLKVVLHHHVRRARVTPATLISEVTLRHSYTCFCSEERLQYALAAFQSNKNYKISAFSVLRKQR